MLEAAAVSPVTTFGFVSGVGLLVDDSKCMLTKIFAYHLQEAVGFCSVFRSCESCCANHSVFFVNGCVIRFRGA